jgi:putative ABC transport system substrate-binding protein
LNRRDLLILGSALAWPFNQARAQQKAMPVIGILGSGSPEMPAIVLNLAGLRQGLKEMGFVEGENFTFEYRWARLDTNRLRELAADLVARRVDVIVTEGGTLPSVAAKNATTTIPIVFHANDAIADGFVNNLARPGGNLTGVSMFAPESLLKEFQLLSELVPGAQVIGILGIPAGMIDYSTMRAIEEMAHTHGTRLQKFQANFDASDSELEAFYASLATGRAGAVVRANANQADRLVGLAARYAVPAVYNQSGFVSSGGLASYGVSLPGVYVLKGIATAKILKGEKPGDLPVQQPTKFELLINLKTAKALGLGIPQLVLAQADEVIE